MFWYDWMTIKKKRREGERERERERKGKKDEGEMGRNEALMRTGYG